MDKKEIKCLILGRVQGVFFRDFARKKALKLNLSGFVKNTEDGEVGVFAQGREEDLRKFISHLKEGPLASKVENVIVKWQELKEKHKTFEIRY